MIRRGYRVRRRSNDHGTVGLWLFLLRMRLDHLKERRAKPDVGGASQYRLQAPLHIGNRPGRGGNCSESLPS